MFFCLFRSTLSLAMILSSESLNSEAIAQNTVADEQSSPNLASNSDDISDKFSDTPTNSERTQTLNTQEIVIINKNDGTGGGAGAKSEYEIQPDQIVTTTQAELSQQPQHQQQQHQQIPIETKEKNEEILEQKITTQKLRDDNV